MEDISELDSKEMKEDDDDTSETCSTSSEVISIKVDERGDSAGINGQEKNAKQSYVEIRIDKIPSTQVEKTTISETTDTDEANYDTDKFVDYIAKLLAGIKIPHTETANNSMIETANISHISSNNKEKRENAPEVFVFNAEQTESPTTFKRHNKNKKLGLKQYCRRLLRVEPSTSCPSKPKKIFELVTGPTDSLLYVQKDVASKTGPLHSFLATIDSILLIMEGTLAGGYRISQNYTGPQIPLLIENTMQSIRVSMERLITQFSHTDPESFEPLASIVRELLTPTLNLFASICPALSCDSTDFYPAINVPKPEPIPEEQASEPPIFVPKLRVFATHDGLIRIILPYTFEIDITTDGAICLKNLEDGTIAAISKCGNYSGIASGLCKVHQHGKVLEMRICDIFSQKIMYGKIGVRGIYFGGTGTPENNHLRLNGETVASPITFSKLDNDFISEIFLTNSTSGPANVEACRTVIENTAEKTLTDGSVHFYCQDIKITQYKNGEVLVNRNKGALLIWCSPEILHSDTREAKKGFIKVVTPVSRVISTIISNPVLAHEKFFLGNLGSQWLYYNTVEFLASNKDHSAGYKDIVEEKEEPAEVPQ